MPRMIRVRSKISGLEATVSELAYGAFAAHYERLDQDETPAAADGEQPAQAEQQAEQPARAAASPKTTRRRTAPNEKE